MALLTALLVGIPTATALAHGFGTSANPDHYVADSSYHTWAETESSDGEYYAMIGSWLAAINGQLRDRTDMSVGQQTYNTNTDVYWYVTPSVGTADATCVDFSSSLVCNQVRVRFNTTWAYTYSSAQRQQGACHEIGHSVGFDDSQPENNTGCMSGGGQGVLSSHEIGHINAQY
ncbi:MAG: hypothetical protein P1T08_18745 [Acidimicrobiia bacterium]|nr:hypothetical protein [Acidimicrobiia bacterium]